MLLSAVIICKNEEQNIARTLASVVDLADEVILLDSGSTDHTLDVARTFGDKVKIFQEEWKGFAAQKNSAIAKASGEWILSLDADEEVSPLLGRELKEALGKKEEPQQKPGENAGQIIAGDGPFCGVTIPRDAYSIPRKNFFMERWIRRGGFYPDRKIRLVKKELAVFEDRAVHEDMKVSGQILPLHGAILHHAYPTLSSYIEHMNRYSSLGAEMVVAKGKHGFSFFNIVVRPWATFLYNYFLRLGFVDGREGLLLHLYHAVYVSWKYAKVWELSRKVRPT
ncbi:glycosyl transferase, family 2 [Candidatus Koribacter versatilis Ellin345]|uniref:Glycosyl transferase, family 2 n=1 Tax=Koribacter versatilis (strain Ellin345) TaxID=204669 RepID=Q1IRQ2_KORVE|nr:glycosyltransferase family 2 protein [Candidatus Koribacter versatilis]ABF40448.1 glycosyl transferase, family 2 [Candidatus Koribacter versatilis Ellin345]